jgi:hypothetical protein
MLAAPPASAEMRCTGASASNVCLVINHVGNGIYDVHLGIDAHMSRQDAQAIIDAPGEPFSGKIYGADSSAQYLFDIPVTDVGASTESGLSANFDITVSGAWLNEDSGRDEIFGRIRLYDARTGTTRIFDTPQIHGSF